MAYHPLTSDAGSTPDQRRAEATKLVKLLVGHLDEMSETQREFVEQMDDEWATVSVKQLFWLRDLVERHS